MHDVRLEIARDADLDVPVLLRGETGVGKELAAAAIHRASDRRERPFVCVNMSALPASTAAAELFGHARGAFTGADSARAGYFEQADGGTLFLDEIGDLPQALQPMLLRALQSGELQRVGGGGKRVDVRVVSATDADLEAAVAAGLFREPLLQRLAAYEIAIPPLRERREDIAPLFLHFLRRELELTGEADRLAAPPAGEKGFLRADFLARLLRHPFPGNARELQNLARRAAVASRGHARLVVDDGLQRMLARSERPPASETEVQAKKRKPAEIDDEALLQALREHAFNLNQTAIALGMSRTWLNTRIERCPLIRKAKDLDAQSIRRAADAHAGDLEAMAATLEVSPRGLQLQMKRLGLR
jgi:two-component system nitrogen regulation response regulator GlnG